jgi:hypothetical protein
MAARAARFMRSHASAVLMIALSYVLVGVAAFPPSARASEAHGTLAVRVTGLPPEQHPAVTVTRKGSRRIVRSRREILTLAPGRYSVTVRPVVLRHPALKGVVSGAVAYPFKKRLSVLIRPGRTTTTTAAYVGVVNPTTKRLPARSEPLGSPSEPARIKLPKGSSAPRVGTIFASGPTASLPDGLIAKVTGVRREAGRYVVAVSPVPVSEATPSITFSGALPLELAPNGRESAGGSVATRGLRGTPRNASCSPPKLINFGVHLDSFQVRQAFLGAWPPQLRLTLAVRTTESLGVSVAAVGINCDWDLGEIGPYQGGIAVGPVVVPVYATLPVKAAMHINGSLQIGTVSVASTTVARAAAGFDENTAALEQQGANEWVSGTPSVTGSAALSASIGVQAGLGLAHGGNAHVEADFGPELDWTQDDGCSLLLNMGSLSAGVTVFSKHLDTPSYTPFKVHLFSGCKPPPPAPTDTTVGGTGSVPTPAPATCPTGQTGSPPDCQPVNGACPPGQTGMPPDCQTPLPSVLAYTGNAPTGFLSDDETFSSFENATGTSVITSEQMPADLSEDQCVILDANTYYSDADKATLSGYVRAGGTIIELGEWADLGSSTGYAASDDALNDLNSTLGSGMSVLEDEQTGTYSTFDIRDPLTATVSDLYYNRASGLSVNDPAQILAVEDDGAYEPLVGQEQIGAGRVALLGDSNMLTDHPGDGYFDYDNGALARFVCSSGG